MLFPDLASLGAGSPPATWKTEYDRVSENAFSPLFVTATGSEGATNAAIKHYPQTTLLMALHTRRAELDSDYDDTAFAPAAVKPRPLGITIRLGL